MGNDVFANGREVSCKAASGKSICAFPDVCFTPPENPATPPGVPVPYPNTGKASDMTSGSKKVKVTNKEVMLKNKSYFKKSMGDEAGCAAKKGVITSTNRGKVYFNAWSMDVKFEGENIVRHLDLTTHNHMSSPPNTPTWPYADRMAIVKGLDDCKEERKEVEDNCKVDKKGNVKCPCGKEAGLIKRAKTQMAKKKAAAKEKWGETAKGDLTAAGKKDPAYVDAKEKLENKFKDYANCMKKDKCQNAAKCMLVEKEPKKPKEAACCPPQTPHHVVPGSQFVKPSGGGPLNQGVKGYKYDEAPCICVEGNSQTQGSHGGIHFETATQTKNMFPPPDEPFSGGERWKVGEAEEVGAKAVHKEFPQCSEKCIKAQLRKKHQEMKVSENDNIRPTAPGPVEHPMNTSSSF